jgi:hypothetical protein
MFPDTRNKNVYGLWVGISTVFNILEHLQIKGDRTTPYGHDLYIPSEETRIYMV